LRPHKLTVLSHVGQMATMPRITPLLDAFVD